MKVRTLWYFSREAGVGLGRNGLMSFAATATVTLSLMLLSCFYIVIANCNHFVNMAKGVLEIRVYLKDGSDPVAVQQRIAELTGVKRLRYVSKNDGAKWLEKNLGVADLFTENENPLPDMVNIKLTDDAKVKPLVQQLTALEGVAEVEYGKTFVESMLIVTRVIGVIGFGLVLIIGLVVLYIIVNTIRLTVLARRKEIEIMKLVGATDWFIRLPFMLEGIFIGLGGAFISIVVMSKGYHLLLAYIKQLAPFIPLLSERLINQGLYLIIPALGVCFGALGSLLSLKRFLRV
ncbi:cell division transport system permease protein [Hydrogenispora ethanolica]|uniref:Cell division protein FtsX n=1 Tax=Hydrogenispora ethanolica TaxID=1082276 RepID=A0A4R1QX78_HYDET|nr:permease-like cell division protein FtsX [Hydrogenispora ethanolica]TCL55360.1 cell division transport system permease protein [Hydrogenispora ethanolica]